MEGTPAASVLTDGTKTAFTSGITAVKDAFVEMVGIALPVALIIWGTKRAINLGMGLFASIAR